MGANARISRVHGSWRVRVFGYPPKFFADSAHLDSKYASLQAAKEWRDAHWDGRDLNRKLTARQRYDIRRSKEHYEVVAERYGISPNYVHLIRRSND